MVTQDLRSGKVSQIARVPDYEHKTNIIPNFVDAKMYGFSAGQRVTGSPISVLYLSEWRLSPSIYYC